MKGGVRVGGGRAEYPSSNYENNTDIGSILCACVTSLIQHWEEHFAQQPRWTAGQMGQCHEKI